jgi:hypothetical protein
MAISKVNYNSLNVTPTASKFLMWNSDADALQASDVGGSLKLISTATASSSGTLNFTSGIDSTYKEYVFKFINIHPGTDDTRFVYQASIDGGTNYNTTMTTTTFRAAHAEGDTSASLGYRTARDQAQGTSYQQLSEAVGADNDQCISGYLHLFDPSNTTFVKHFISQGPATISNDNLEVLYVAGYHNTTSAINAVSFKFESGNIDSGVIKMYGVL